VGEKEARDTVGRQEETLRRLVTSSSCESTELDGEEKKAQPHTHHRMNRQEAGLRLWIQNNRVSLSRRGDI